LLPCASTTAGVARPSRGTDILPISSTSKPRHRPGLFCAGGVPNRLSPSPLNAITARPGPGPHGAGASMDRDALQLRLWLDLDGSIGLSQRPMVHDLLGASREFFPAKSESREPSTRKCVTQLCDAIPSLPASPGSGPGPHEACTFLSAAGVALPPNAACRLLKKAPAGDRPRPFRCRAGNTTPAPIVTLKVTSRFRLGSDTHLGGRKPGERSHSMCEPVAKPMTWTTSRRSSSRWAGRK
jgi:hypothetical protein